MADGVVKCCGSPLFLKKHYTEGYTLTAVKEPGCDAAAVLAFVQRHVGPAASIKAELGKELAISLPRAAVPRFETLFAELEDHQDSLLVQ